MVKIDQMCERVFDFMDEVGINYYPTNFEFKKNIELDREIRKTYGHHTIRETMGVYLKREYLNKVRQGKKKIAQIKANKIKS
jgi:hypothetical protein